MFPRPLGSTVLPRFPKCSLQGGSMIKSRVRACPQPQANTLGKMPCVDSRRGRFGQHFDFMMASFWFASSPARCRTNVCVWLLNLEHTQKTPVHLVGSSQFSLECGRDAPEAPSQSSQRECCTCPEGQASAASRCCWIPARQGGESDHKKRQQVKHKGGCWPRTNRTQAPLRSATPSTTPTHNGRHQAPSPTPAWLPC